MVVIWWPARMVLTVSAVVAVEAKVNCVLLSLVMVFTPLWAATAEPKMAIDWLSVKSWLDVTRAMFGGYVDVLIALLISMEMVFASTIVAGVLSASYQSGMALNRYSKLVIWPAATKPWLGRWMVVRGGNALGIRITEVISRPSNSTNDVASVASAPVLG